MPTKLGDKIEFTVSPGLILAIEAELTSWVIHLSELGDIDLERESMSKAQVLIGFIKGFGYEHGAETPAIASLANEGQAIGTFKAEIV